MSSRFLHTPGERIQLADLAALCRFRTDSSISFDLGHVGDRILELIGYVDVHYPCDQKYCPVHFRVVLPIEYGDPEWLHRLIDELYLAFAIPEDVGYELRFNSMSEGLLMIDRDDVL